MIPAVPQQPLDLAARRTAPPLPASKPLEARTEMPRVLPQNRDPRQARPGNPSSINFSHSARESLSGNPPSTSW